MSGAVPMGRHRAEPAASANARIKAQVGRGARGRQCAVHVRKAGPCGLRNNTKQPLVQLTAG